MNRSYFGEADWEEQTRRKAEQMEREFQHNEKVQARQYKNAVMRARGPMPGDWSFGPLHNDGGELLGWRVELNGKIAGMIVSRGKDLVVLASGNEYDMDSPTTTDIMAAYTAFGPGAAR